MDSINILIFGKSRLNTLVISIPDILGNEMSIKTTTGICRFRILQNSAALEASATTSIPKLSEINDFMPSRTS